jgi:DNA-directed RNA polymerase subunit M/transcription elongation factor TFIIS
MPNFISWPCPSCGSALEVAAEVSRVTCDACGDEHIINRIGDKFTLIPLKNKGKKPDTGFDKAASEAAFNNFKKEFKKSE